MPQWSNTPPERTTPRPLPIIRTPVGKSLAATILSDEMIGCPTHFWGGRTSPCEAPDCDACNHGSPTRWHAYLAIYSAENQSSAILELPDAAAEQLALLARGLPTLRGARIRVSRTKSTRNARVIVDLRQPLMPQPPIPAAPDLPAIMAIIWKLPASTISTEQSDLRRAAIKLDALVLAKRNGKPLPPKEPDATPRR